MQPTEKIWKYSLEEIDLFAENLIAYYNDILIWIFKPEMGMGKTTLIKAMCKKWGVRDSMSSPTFGLINEYKAGTQSVYHIDLYRLTNWDEVENIGIMDLLYSGSRCLIEWPDLLLGHLPFPYVQINGILAEGNFRIFSSQLYV